MKRLVINADDFGMCAGVDHGIGEAMTAGVVTSTSCLVFGEPPVIPAAIRGRVGVHLRLTDGAPVCASSEIPSLVNAEGRFPSSREAVRMRRISAVEVEREWRAQMAMFLRSGVKPTHIDTHHHSHGLVEVAPVYARLAAEWRVAGVPVGEASALLLRATGVRCADEAEIQWNVFHVGEPLLDRVGRIFASGRTSVHLMAHPGYVDESLRGRSSMVESRRAELDLLMSPRFRQSLKDDGIELIGMESL
jgi:chitin disaccharide deacetylase